MCSGPLEISESNLGSDDHDRTLRVKKNVESVESDSRFPDENSISIAYSCRSREIKLKSISDVNWGTRKKNYSISTTEAICEGRDIADGLIYNRSSFS